MGDLLRFYFVSTDSNLDGITIQPRIPLNKMETENNETKRICVSTSIAGCLLATPRYEENEIVYVYSCDSFIYMQPSIVDVPDVPTTGEIWILEPIKLSYFTKIKVQNVSDFSSTIDLKCSFIN